MEAKTQKNKWFTWHLLPAPKDYPIQSVLELAVLIISLAVLFFIYGMVNNVNVIDEELELAYLDKLRNSPNHSLENVDSSYRYKKADVLFYLPMTGSEQLIDSCHNVEVFIVGADWKSSHNLLNNYSVERGSMKIYDSLIFAKFPKAGDNITKYLYHYGQKIRIRDWVGRKMLETSSKIDTIRSGACLEKIYNDDTCAYTNTLISGEKQRYLSVWKYENHISFFGHPIKVNPLLGNPGWFALEDVSQTYFKFKLRTFDIDSLSLKIDFVGATEFLEMQPKPDETGMSYIKFTDLKKIEQIQKNGLLFHAKFRELENRQSVRIFFLTALLSVNVISLIVFMFFASYKMIYAWREKRAERKSKNTNKD